MSAQERIALLGSGRMGRGIALVFAYAGHPVEIVDFKDRPPGEFEALARTSRAEIADTLSLLADIGLFADRAAIGRIAARVEILPKARAAEAFERADIVFEGVPEVLDVKREALREASALVRPGAVIASTTSTILVDDLAPSVAAPERFLNAHWLNPAFLMPLVELSPGRATSEAATQRLTALLERIGKVPVRCAPVPGYIVPRLQTLVMNEAARMVEEGSASAEDIEKAVTYGFGLRFSVLGLLEFIDWGGGDILFHASRYLVEATGEERYGAPGIVEQNMATGRIGMSAGEGFLDWRGRDMAAHRRERLRAFAARIDALGLARAPVL